MKTSETPEAITEWGRIAGKYERGVAVFRGVPFAAPPFGERRFERADPPDRWDGVRDATRPGVGCVQRWQTEDPWDGYLNPRVQGEDVLTLEITTPEPGEGGGLPVMVWIHGGGFTEGVGSAPAHGGHTFAVDGIVHVSVNYRLGFDGFGQLEDSIDSGTENLGLRDQVAALEWVQQNIRAFGGDPGRVTIAGQSAGAISVLCLLSSPLARGLFHQAVVESGFPTGVRDIAAADRSRSILARSAGRPATRGALRDLTLDETRQTIVRGVGRFAAAAVRGRGQVTDMPFMITHGGESLPEAPSIASATGLGAETPVLIGTTRDELAGLLGKAGLHSRWTAPLVRPVLRRFGVPRGAPRVYRTASRSGARSAVILSAALTDAVARIPAIRLAEERPGPTYLYEFAWESPGLPEGLGADHVVDVPFVRNDFESFRRACPAGDEILGSEPPRRLATAMHGAFADFVLDGDPGWRRYDGVARSTMRFDTESRVVSDLAGPEREFWASA